MYKLIGKKTYTRTSERQFKQYKKGQNIPMTEDEFKALPAELQKAFVKVKEPEPVKVEEPEKEPEQTEAEEPEKEPEPVKEEAKPVKPKTTKKAKK